MTLFWRREVVLPAPAFLKPDMRIATTRRFFIVNSGRIKGPSGCLAL